jgi:predicted O-methyltransferase YrrM
LELRVINSLLDPSVKRTLDRMHHEASITDPPLLRVADNTQGEQRAALLDQAFIPVSEEAGRFLYGVTRASRPGTAIEFGTSFGISTIYLAAATRDRGAGKVITTELHAGKAEKARSYIADAGLLDRVEIRVGDALETLTRDVSEVSIVFLDGWKNLYLPVLQLLEPNCRPGTLIVADDLNLFPTALQPYLAYVRDPAHGYVSVEVPIGDSMEMSIRT